MSEYKHPFRTPGRNSIQENETHEPSSDGDEFVSFDLYSDLYRKVNDAAWEANMSVDDYIKHIVVQIFDP